MMVLKHLETGVIPSYSIEYLVVAGGGSAGSGGGGGGGMRTTSSTFTQGTVLTATVGAGGTATYV